MPPFLLKLLPSIGLPIVFLLSGAAGGGWAVYKLYHLGQVRELKHAIEEQADQHKSDLALLAGHHQNLMSIERSKVKTREIVKYVKDNRECDVVPDAVRLLNEARQGVQPATSGTAKDAGTVAQSLGLPQRVEIQAHADCGIKYRQLSEQLTALIKWHASQ